MIYFKYRKKYTKKVSAIIKPYGFTLLIAFLCCLTLFVQNTLAESYSGSVYVSQFKNDVPLDHEIRCAAVSSDGCVAVKSASSKDENGWIIAVYSKEGNFLYGYYVSIELERGFPKLFFNSQNELCYLTTPSFGENLNQRLVITFHPETNTYTYRLTEDDSEISMNNYVLFKSNTYICVRKDSPFALHSYSASQLSIMDKTDNTVYIPCDFSSHFDEYQKIRNKQIVIGGIGCAGLAIILCLIISKMHQNLQEAKR